MEVCYGAVRTSQPGIQENENHMANKQTTLDNVKKETKVKIDVVEVVKHGDRLVIPEGMTLERVDKVIHDRMNFESQTTGIHAEIETPFVFEAAYAFFRAMKEMFGWVNTMPTPGFFGDNPPTMISVPIGPGKTVQVPWGRFSLPTIDGFLETGAGLKKKGGPFFFYVGGEIKRMHEDKVNALVELTKKYVREESIYKGQAFRLRLTDEDDNPIPLVEPRFLDLNPAVEQELVFGDEVMSAIRTNLFTPIERTAEVRALGVPLKRGVLLAGDYGTGKTMAAHATAVKCVRAGWTYIVCEHAEELGDVLRIAREYGPSVVFCEDIDRLMTETRSVDIDHVLNVIDGVESKSAELMIVLTTNNVKAITQALLRPGRLDAVIHVAPPDAAAAERLARQYSRGLIPEDEDITPASKQLAGKIAAVIREVVERSKLSALSLTQPGEPLTISNAALLDAARTMDMQLELLTPKPDDNRSETVKAADILAKAMKEAADAGVPVGVPFPVRPSAFQPDGDISFETAYDDRHPGQGTGPTIN